MNEVRDVFWKVLALGARPLLRRHHFKRPGGGARFIRGRGRLQQVITFMCFWQGETGKAVVWASQHLEHHQLMKTASHDFRLDLRHGDPGDTAVALAHWLETELLPPLDVELDLTQAARAYEMRPTPNLDQLQESAALWALLGHPEEAQRVTAEYVAKQAECPF